MPSTVEKTIYLVTIFGQGDEPDTERLLNSPTRASCVGHVIGVNKASAADVARVLGAGGKVEDIA